MWEVAKGYDVIVVVEWGKGEELVELFPGYTAYFNQLSITSPRNQRGAGRGEGICVMVKGTIPSKLLEHTRHATWVQVGRGDNKLVVAGTYIHGEGSRVWVREAGGLRPVAEAREAAFEGLRDNLLRYKSIGPLVLLGDFNARVGALPDVDPTVQSIIDSMGLASEEVISTHTPLSRKSQDTAGTDAFGKLLITQCCIEAGCILLNGRAPGDEHGACTRESACLDYGLTTMAGYPLVESFRVLPLEPLSDHKPIECCIMTATDREEAHRGEHPHTSKPVPRWDPARREEYVQSLMSGEHGRAISDIEEGLKNGSLDPISAACQLSEAIHKAAVGVFGVVGQNKDKLPSGRAPNRWFKHCRQEYQALRDALRRGDSHAAKQRRKEFRRVQRKWERYFDSKQQARMVDDLKHNPRKFWSAFKGRRCSMVQFDMQQLHTYWDALYGGTGRGELGQEGQDLETLLQHLGVIARASQGHETAKKLNAPLMVGEVEMSLKKLHCGRAPGPDGLRAEHLKCAYTETVVGANDDKVVREYQLVPVLHLLYNALFTSGQYVREWSLASLTAVFKKGDATSLDNYRAIAVGAVFGKLYAVLLDRRLSSLAEKAGWRAEGQAGFRPEKSTMDHVFVLRHLIEATQADSRSAPLFCCFVDFRKAYDKVRRDMLVQRLAELGVHGHMLQAIAQMYWEAPLVPKLGTALGPEIASKCGVKQGDPLSPLLFGLFIDEFESRLRERLPGAGVQLGTRLLQMLLYADDMVLFASNPETLQRQLDLLHEFCVAKGMEVNVAKTEIVVFRHHSQAAQQAWTWHYHGSPIQRVSEFKYLGVVMHETKGVSVAIASLAAAARRAAWAMISRFRVGKVRDISLKLKMFKALVLPIMEYCGAVWCPDILVSCQHMYQMLDNPLQQVQTTFLRGLGQLRKSISTTVLHKEMCMDPVAKGWLRASLDLWGRLQRAPADSILGAAVRESIRRAQSSPPGRPSSWVGKYMRMLSNMALGGQRDPDQALRDFAGSWGVNAEDDRLLAVPSGVVWDAWEKMMAEPWEGLTTDPRTAPSAKVRMVTYNSWFAVPLDAEIEEDSDYPQGMPQYIRRTGGIPFEQVKQLMRLRTGAHYLRVETGRWQQPRLPRGERVCQKCTWGTMVEDEFHMLFECPRYHRIRAKYEQSLFAKFGGVAQAPRIMTTPGKMSAFMNQEPRQVAAFVWECMHYRRHESPDLVPYAAHAELEELGLEQRHAVDTFSSDYEDYVDEMGDDGLNAHGA